MRAPKFFLSLLFGVLIVLSWIFFFKKDSFVGSPHDSLPTQIQAQRVGNSDPELPVLLQQIVKAQDSKLLKSPNWQCKFFQSEGRPSRDLPDLLSYHSRSACKAKNSNYLYVANFPENFEVVAAKVLASGSEIAVVLDHTVEGRMKTIPFYLSSDQGQSWTLVSYLEKTEYHHEVLDIQEDQGVLSVSVSVEDPQSTYQLISTDHGLHWSVKKI